MTTAVLIFAGFGLGVCTMAAIERHRRAVVTWLFRVTCQQMPDNRRVLRPTGKAGTCDRLTLHQHSWSDDQQSWIGAKRFVSIVQDGPKKQRWE
jgi:hypothetical protein